MSKFLEDMFIDVREKPNKDVGLSSLMEMVEKTMETLDNLNQNKSFLLEAPPGFEPGDAAATDSDRNDNVTVIRRPTIKITELWGKTENGDRDIMESLMNKIQGNTVQQKIESVNRFLEAEAPPPGEGDISEIMSYLIFLDTFASIVNDYGASVSGFLFEAFLAALMGGTSVQIDDPADVGAAPGSLPIEDVQLMIKQSEEADAEIKPYSLKLLRRDGVVKGSFKNIVDYFLDPAEGRKTDSIVYLIVTKDAEKLGGGKLGEWNGTLKFFEFTITRDNFLQLIGAPSEVPVYDYRPVTLRQRTKQAVEKAPSAIRGFPRYKTLDGEDIPEDTVMDKGTEVLRIVDTGETEKVIKGGAAKLYTPDQYEKITGKFADAPDIDRQIFGALQDTKGYQTEQQWSIGHGVYTKSFIGQIKLEPELLKTRAEDYTQSLNTSIVKIFNALGDLSDNINKYFIGAGEDMNRKAVGVAAKKDADTLKQEVDATIS
ncbi:MAG: hypothetical protein CMF52_03105 [Legionellales bacterium]|nr:hypothetical protein [Legionellales bacterium]